MREIIFDEERGFPSTLHVADNRVEWNTNAYPEYMGTRAFKDMKSLYKQVEGIADDLSMYFTSGRVALKKDRKLFKEHHVTYEYTVIPVRDVHGECNKTHGHVHGIHPKTGKRRLEAFEILHGYGCFELFKEVKEKEFDCLLILLRKGDRLIVPSDYFHLSINMSKEEPFIFSDLIKDDVDTIYSYVKEKNGAPYRVFHDEYGKVYYELHDHWKDCTIHLKVLTVEELPWSNPFERPLYEDFVNRTDAVTALLEG